MARIIVACGSGIATSQTVAAKVDRLLRDRGVEATVEAVDFKSLDEETKKADGYISIVRTDREFGIPVFNGVAFLTGFGQDEELEKLVQLIESK